MGCFDHFAKGEATAIGAWLEKKTKENEYKYLSKFLVNTDIEILEIGAGHGLLASVFLKNGFKNYDAVEPNELMNKKLADGGIRNVKNYLIPVLKEPDNTYDLIILTDVLEHLNDMKEAQLFAKEAYRTLRKKGILMIKSPDYYDCGQDFFNCDYTHNYITTLRRTRQLMQNYGFKILSCRYTHAIFTGIIGLLIDKFIKISTTFSTGDLSDSNRIYKLRLTFLRSFTIIGKKC